MIVNPDGTPRIPPTLAERQAVRRRRMWRVIDAAVPGAALTLSFIVWPMIIHYGLGPGTIALTATIFALWCVTVLRLADVGPGSRTGRP